MGWVLMFLSISKALVCVCVTGSALSWRICGGSWRRTALWLDEPSKKSWTRPGRSRRGDIRWGHCRAASRAWNKSAFYQHHEHPSESLTLSVVCAFRWKWRRYRSVWTSKSRRGKKTTRRKRFVQPCAVSALIRFFFSSDWSVAAVYSVSGKCLTNWHVDI